CGAGDGRPSRRTRVQTIDESFGAVEIVGVEPRELDEQTATHVRDALARHAVIVLRLDRALDDDEARAVASLVGPVKDPVGRTRDRSTLRYSEERQIIDAGFVLTDELRAGLGDLEFGGLDPLRPGLFE